MARPIPFRISSSAQACSLAASPVRASCKHAVKHRSRIFALAGVVLLLCAAGYADKIQIPGRFPIQDPQGHSNLSPPHVYETNECATNVYVDSFVPHATINIYLVVPPPLSHKPIGGPVDSFFGYDAIPLTQALKTNDEVEATQTVNGVTSAYSKPMKVDAMPTTLHDPDVLPPFYACGQIVPVDGLVSGVKLEVQDSTASSIIGTDTIPNFYSSDGWDPPTVSPLEAPPKTSPAHEVRAKQEACTGAHSNFGKAKKIDNEPSGCHPPTVEKPIIDNDAVTLDDLYTGALVQIYDHATLESTTLAVGTSNTDGLNHKVTAMSDIRAKQTLCSSCGESTPVKPTNDIPPLTLVSPICEGQPAAFVTNSTVNAILVLFKPGPVVIGYGGAAPGEVPIYLAPPASFNKSDEIQVAEYIGSNMVMSNTVKVGCKIYTRHDIAKLTPAQIDSIKKGLVVMMKRSLVNPNDPTGITFQANIHSTPPGSSMCMMGDPSNPHWDQCQHSSDLFFPWHRMYLYYFERILRAASGDPNLTLPYWNYELSTEQTLPADFLMPAIDCAGDPASHPGCNPLYTPGRIMNSGATLPMGGADDSLAMGDTSFEPSAGGNFGGGPPPGTPPVPCHFDSDNGDLEQQPHNVIHCYVGGIFCSTHASANDPIFWLHHSEIDHLWKVWLAKGGARANPTSDTDWMNTSFSFYDETGTLVSKSVKDALDTVAQLQYRYDDDPPVRKMVRPAPRGEEAPRPLPLTQPEQLAVNPQAGVELSNMPARAQLEISPQIAEKINRLLEDKEYSHAIVLKLDVDHVKDSSGVAYEIYADLPGNQEANHQSIYYVGTLGLFLPRNAKTTVHFDLTRTIRALSQKQAWSASQLSITFVPRGLVDAKTGQPLPLEPGSRATIDRISLVAR